MAGRYRALLIGNSTYPADEHNLQTLRGPVKDIAVLNRALIDPDAGLFADVDVTLLPEATSTRAIRALGRFFGTADRDDVLLVYFSGHGKIDQSGRLHLCMQDTESTDLLSTAVSSARITEFADASHARNVVIVLDCCYAGAFRGAELGDAVAGPGRYVLTSCRGTQLANDATVDNGTSFFTQHLVDGLVDAAADQDGDGYVTFSDLYAYVDRRLREAGKQIPQRRVDGDGDLPLARRPQPAPAEVAPEGGALPVSEASPSPLDPGDVPPGSKGPPGGPPPAGPPPAGPPPAGPVAGDSTAGSAPVGGSPRPTRTQRNILLAAAGAAVVVGGVIAGVLLTGGSGGTSHSSAEFQTSGNTVTSGGPWRLKIDDRISPNDNGCTITLTDTHSGQQIRHLESLYGTTMFQIYQAGSFRWQVNDRGCLVAPQAGPGKYKLPFAWPQGGDSDAFATSPDMTVQVKNYNGSPDCKITLNDPTNGQTIDFQTATRGKASDTVTLNANGHPTAYLSDLICAVRVSAGH
jgi:Caspase domain